MQSFKIIFFYINHIDIHNAELGILLYIYTWECEVQRGIKSLPKTEGEKENSEREGGQCGGGKAPL